MLTSREDRELRALQQRKSREREGRFVAEGVRVVEDLLASPLEVYWAAAASSLEDSERGQRLINSVEQRGIALRRLSDLDFRRAATTEHPQGILAIAGIPFWELPVLMRRDPPHVILVLDAVQDPGNFGTLVRSAEALGASGVIALPGTVDPWNAKAVRAAVGSTFRLPVVPATWEAAKEWLRGEGFRILGAAVGGSPASQGLGRVALVVGNEGAGLSDAVVADADALVGIPLRGRAESLNVAAAAAILLHELTR